MGQAQLSLSFPRLYGATGRWGCLQLAVARSAVVVDLQTRTRDTEGHSHFCHATAALPIADARLLLAELTAALAEVGAVPEPGWQDRLATPETARWGRHPRRAVAS